MPKKWDVFCEMSRKNIFNKGKIILILTKLFFSFVCQYLNLKSHQNHVNSVKKLHNFMYKTKCTDENFTKILTLYDFHSKNKITNSFNSFQLFF